MATIALDHVRKRYPNGHEAVREFTLAIADGEFVVLVGPSGCGKSTTLRLVAGLEDLTGGTIRIGDRVVNDVHPKDRDIAMVFQNYALYPHMSVRENMSFALKLRGVAKDEIKARVLKAAQSLGIEDLLDRKPRQLSGGQRQRVAVGRAIVREPKAFLFDEPLSNLDAKLRVTTRAELKALHQRLRTTTIYVTHDQEEAMTLGDRIVVMADGIIQQAGPPLEVYRKPVNRFVASFIGMPPMNLLEGTLARDGDAIVFVEGSSEAGGKPYRLAFPGGRSAALSGAVGRPVVLGLRPQMLRLAGAESPTTVRAPISVVEPLGDLIDVFCSTPKHARLVARVNAGDATATLRPGGEVLLEVDMGHAHVFEPGPFGKSIG